MIVYDPSRPGLRDDPYPTYRELREREPVHWSEPLDAWVLTGYADVVDVLRDPRFSSDFGNSDGYDPERDPFGEVLRSLMLFKDAPDHTRLRSLVHKAFTPRVVAALRPRIAQIVSELLDGAARAGGMDAIGDFAYPLPVIVICELLGIPASDRSLFRGWTAPLARMLDPLAEETVPDELMREAGEAVTGFMTYFLDLVGRRRREPSSDLVSALVGAEQQGDVLADEEILSMCGLLLIAGHETTMNLIGNGLMALLREPLQAAAALSDVRTAVEELLRYDSPVQLTARTALEDVEVSGVRVQKGRQVIALLGAANRDPAEFERPDMLEVTRRDNRHVAFGAGPHFCLGAPLARVEGHVAFEALLPLLPGLRLASEPARRATVTLRGLRELPVEFV